MFARSFRLPHSVVLRSSKQFHFSVFRVKYQQNNLPNNRYGFIAGKRIDKSAVVRNRTKRILRSEVEALNSRLKSGFDFLFVLTRTITEENKLKAREEVREFFKNEGLIIK